MWSLNGNAETHTEAYTIGFDCVNPKRKTERHADKTDR